MTRSIFLLAVVLAVIPVFTLHFGAIWAIIIVGTLTASGVAAGKPVHVFFLYGFHVALRSYLRAPVAWGRAQLGMLAAIAIIGLLFSQSQRLVLVHLCLSYMVLCFGAARLGCFNAGCCRWKRTPIIESALFEFIVLMIICCVGIFIYSEGKVLLATLIVSVCYVALRLASLSLQSRFSLAKRESWQLVLMFLILLPIVLPDYSNF